MFGSTSTSKLLRPLVETRRTIGVVGFFSAVINLLMLTGPLFMLQVYDRVLINGSLVTLAVLFCIVVYCYGLMGVLDAYRGRILARIAAKVQVSLDRRAFDAAVLRQKSGDGWRNVGQVHAVSVALGIGAIFDLPWTPLFIGALFLFHPLFGVFALGALVLVLCFAVLNHALTTSTRTQAGKAATIAEAHVNEVRTVADTAKALGMGAALGDVWHDLRQQSLRASLKATDRSATIAAASRSVRMVLQSAMLGLGAILVIQGQLTAGAMVAGSILLGRALSPVEQVVAHLPQLQSAYGAWKSLEKFLAGQTDQSMKLPLPRPAALIEMKNLAVCPEGGGRPILQGISFDAAAGDAIAVIGPTGAGKSTLAKVIAGAWPAAIGEVRLGGATLGQYEPDLLGSYFGYVPQDVALFNGTVAQNISRFSHGAEPQQIIEAARAAAAHEMILGLPNGYDTVIEHGGAALSAGQKQRISIARAVFGDPVAFVLDEPKAHLDDPGVQALNQIISQARDSGKIVFVITNHPTALAECNKVLVLNDGQMRAFGPREAVLRQSAAPREVRT